MRLPTPPLAMTGIETGVGHRPGQAQIEAVLAPSRSMLVRRISPAPRDTLGPFDGIEAGAVAPAVGEDSHLPGATCLASMATTMHWLPTLPAASPTTCGLLTAAVLMLTLSAPALSRRRTSSTVNAAADGEGMKTCSATCSDHVQDDVAVVGTGGDVEEGDLVGALLVVADGRFRPGRRHPAVRRN